MDTVDLVGAKWYPRADPPYPVMDHQSGDIVILDGIGTFLVGNCSSQSRGCFYCDLNKLKRRKQSFACTNNHFKCPFSNPHPLIRIEVNDGIN
jgi:hypothetical protein